LLHIDLSIVKVFEHIAYFLSVNTG